MAAREPDVFAALIDTLVEASADYLIGQLRAGADVRADIRQLGRHPRRARFRALVDCADGEARRQGARGRCLRRAIIGFPKGAGLGLERYAAATGVDAIGLDWTVPLDFARDRLQRSVAVQGNLDPAVLLAGGDGARPGDRP